jgi:4-amino-4-deoxy-L-arabinose transferase-like glycosyltransferase
MIGGLNFFSKFPLLRFGRAAASQVRDQGAGRFIRYALLFAGVGALIAVWLVALGQRVLLNPDEGRYATLSLAMMESGDWVTPRLNGLLYFEKPPLQYWGGALAYELFGVSELSARLWPGLAGLITIALVGWTGWRLWGRRTGVHAAAITAGSTWIVANSHFLSLDAGLTAALTLVLCSVLRAEQPGIERSEARRWMVTAWAGIGLAVLSKGLVGLVIPGAVLVLVSLIGRDWRLWTRMAWVPGLVVLALITVPWFALMTYRHADFAHFFFIHEHFERYLTQTHHRVGSGWYFVPLLLVGFLPWTGSLPWLLREPTARPDRDGSALRWLRVWVIFVFVFFSLSGSKLPSYILPLFPALALLLARRIESLQEGRWLCWQWWVPLLAWLSIGVLSFLLAGRLEQPTPPGMAEQLGSGLRQAVGVYLIGAAVAWVSLRRQRFTAALISMAIAQMLAVLMLMSAYEAWGQFRSLGRLINMPAVQQMLRPETRVYALRAYDQTLPFYLRRPVVLVEYVSEFEFGQRQEPARWVPTLAALRGRWLDETSALAYMEPETLRLLQQQGWPLRVLHEDALRVLVSRH